jgi:hypothetical protein
MGVAANQACAAALITPRNENVVLLTYYFKLYFARFVNAETLCGHLFQ